MAGALVKRELHLLLFSMLYDWQEEGGSEGEGEEESGDKKRGAEGRGEGDGAESEETSAMSGQDSVENERDCKWGEEEEFSSVVHRRTSK